MRCLSANQRKFIIERIVKGQTICVCQMTSRRLSKDQWAKLVFRKWNEKSATEDLHRLKSGRPRTNLTRENVEKVSYVLYDDGKIKTIRKVLATTGLPYSGVCDILVKEINLYPYKARVSQKLNARQIENRLAFCHRLKNMIGNFELNLNQIIFSDLSHFYLDGVPNWQNNRIRSSSRPDFTF